uniref:Uncharacterized protein n=1 Tax=Solanum lycopersicum TaxID=4081 RepID=A0A3Q7EGS7_SOLLC
MSESIHLQDLVVTKVECTIHLLQAPLYRIISKLCTRLATHKVSNKWPPMVTKTRVVILNHLFIFIYQNSPVTVQVISILKINLITPYLLLCCQYIYHCRLIISFKNWSIFKLPSKKRPGFLPYLSLWSHRCQHIK